MEVTLYYYKNLVVEWFEKLEKLNGEKGVTHDQLIKLFCSFRERKRLLVLRFRLLS